MGRFAIVLCCALGAPAMASPPEWDVPPRLLDAPRWISHGQAVIALSGTGAAVHLAWLPVEAAVRYHVMWTDAAGQPTDLATDATVLDRAGVAPGHYEVTIAAIDRHGFDGVLSPPQSIDVADVRATPPGSEAPAPPTRGAYAIGTRFAAPAQSCTLGGVPATREARAEHAGMVELRCGDARMRIVIAPVVVASMALALPRGQTSVVHVTVGSVAALGEHLEVRPIGDIELGPAQRSALGLDVPVIVAPHARTAGLAIAADDLSLGQVALALRDVAPEPAPATEPAWWAIDVGGHLGGWWPQSNGRFASAVGHPADPRDAISAAGGGGGQVGIFLMPRIGLEVEASWLAGGYAGGAATSELLAIRGQLAIRAFDRGRLGVRLVGGAGALTLWSTHRTSRTGSSGELHGGVAFTIETRRDLWLRLQAIDVVTTALDAGYAHGLELELALVTRFGRRDRW